MTPTEELLLRVSVADAPELDKMAAVYVMGWTHHPRLPQKYWLSVNDGRLVRVSKLQWSPTNEDRTTFRELEAELERRGLHFQYVEELKLIVLGFPFNHLTNKGVWKMLRATATQRTRAAVLACLKATLTKDHANAE